VETRVGSVALPGAKPSRAHRFQTSGQIANWASKTAWVSLFGGLWWICAGMLEIPWWMRLGIIGLSLTALFIPEKSSGK